MNSPTFIMPFIENVSLKDIKIGRHYDAGENSCLIQIVDPAMEFPEPKYNFKEVHRFEFLDLEGNEGFAEEFLITDEQAAEIHDILNSALERRMNVIVHCVAGVCRSGAVAEVGVVMGFRDTETYRQPNLLVKRKLMNLLNNCIV